MLPARAVVPTGEPDGRADVAPGVGEAVTVGVRVWVTAGAVWVTVGVTTRTAGVTVRVTVGAGASGVCGTEVRDWRCWSPNRLVP